jgi:hypothetical protein
MARKIDPAELRPAFWRTRNVLTLEFGDRRDFDDPRREWRRLFSELLGTFALVLVAAGGGLLHAKGQISLAAAVIAPGLMVTAIILFMGAVSGAHLNPAVSLAFALRGDFPWKRIPGYIIIQLGCPPFSGHLNLRLSYAAAAISRYSSITSCGVRYPSAECRRFRL